MPLYEPSCCAGGHPIDCLTDSITVCSGDDPIIVEIEGVTPVSGAIPVVFEGGITVSLDCATDSVTVCPGDDPLEVTVTGTVDLGATTLAALETINVNQSGAWTVALDAGTLAALETITVLQGTSPWVIGDGGGSITVDGSVTVAGTITTNYERAEDTGHTTGNIGAFVLAVRNDAGTPLAADLDYIPFTTDATGALRVTGSAGTSNITNGAETAVSSSAVQVIATNATRKNLVIHNVGLGSCRIGASGVTATTGFRLDSGGIAFFDTAVPVNAVFAIRDGGIDTVVLAQEMT